MGLAVLILGGGTFAISQLLGDDDTPAPPNQAAPPPTDRASPTTSESARPTPPAGETNVAVLNGTTITGLAGQLADRARRGGRLPARDHRDEHPRPDARVLDRLLRRRLPRVGAGRRQAALDRPDRAARHGDEGARARGRRRGPRGRRPGALATAPVSLFARAVFVLLVAATFAAFFVAQRLKSAPQVAVIRKATLQFSPNGDGRRDVSRIRVRVRKDDDVTISIVDARGHGDQAARHRRPGDAGALGPGLLGRAGRGRRARAGRRLPRARQPASRRPRGDARARDPARHDRAAADGVRRRPGRPGVDHRPRRGSGPVPRARRLDALPDAHARAAHRPGPSRARWPRSTLPPGERDGEWDGLAYGAPAPPGTYQVVAAVRDMAGNVGRSAPAAGARRRARSARRQRPRRCWRGRPPTRCAAGETATFSVDSRGRPYRWRLFRVGEPKPRRKGRKPSGGELKVRAPRGDSGVYVLDSVGHDSTRVPFAVQGADARADPRRAAGDHLVRPRHARRRPRRAAQHARDREPGRLSAAARRRAARRASAIRSRRCWRSWTARRSTTTSPPT